MLNFYKITNKQMITTILSWLLAFGLSNTTITISDEFIDKNMIVINKTIWMAERQLPWFLTWCFVYWAINSDNVKYLSLKIRCELPKGYYDWRLLIDIKNKAYIRLRDNFFKNY